MKKYPYLKIKEINFDRKILELNLYINNLKN